MGSNLRRSIVDAHHHLWDPQVKSYPWLEGPPYESSIAGDVALIARRYLFDDYLADAASFDVRKSVHVDSGCIDSLAETAGVALQAQESGKPVAIVAGVSLHDPDFQRQLEQQLIYPQLRGVRHILNWHPDPLLTFSDRSDYMTDAQWLRGYKALGKHGLSFDLQVYPWQLPDAAKLATHHPDTLVILNHAGMPLHQHGNGLKSWRTGMRALAACENAIVKISGLGMMNWNWTTESIRPFVLETIDIFGVNRCMFASNFPVDKLYSSFEVLFSSFELIVDDFSEAEKKMLFESNAEKFYRI